jgi:HSP20 family protein
MTKKKMEKEESKLPDLSGILGGFANLLGKLDELAKTGKDLKEWSETHGTDSQGREMKGVFGYNVKVGLGKDNKTDFKIEPFGNFHEDKKTGEPIVHEAIEPIVDIFEEATHTIVVVEMPGIGMKDVTLDVNDDLLIIKADKGKKKYYKEILLPKSYPKEKVTIASCNNGILEIKCNN